MNENERKSQGWRAIVPTGGKSLVVLLVVAVVAFSLGLLLSGDGNQASSTVDQDGHDHAEAEPTTWTCSMHPQIQLPEPGKCPICFMDLIPLESGGGESLEPSQLKMTAAARELARIETTPVRRAFAEAEIRMVGRLTYDETRLSDITAWVPGRLDTLYADYTGVRVARGDHMVSIYSPDLVAAQEELIQARKALETISDRSEILRSTARATVDAAREKLRLSGLTEQQINRIENSGAVTDQLTIYAPAGGTVVEKHAKEGQYVKTGTRIYTIADLTKLWATFEAYESDLPWLRYGQSVQFTSPSFPGEVFTAIITFIDPVINEKTRTARIRAIVDNPKLRLKPDMFVSGVVSSKLDSEGNVIDERLAGKWISPMHPEVVKSGPGVCDVCGMDLVPAESLGYSTMVASDEAPLLIPSSAPLLTGKRAVVYVQIRDGEDGPVFEGRQVRLGPRAGDFFVVKSGLEEGEAVVTNGAFKIDAELQIQAKPSMMAAEQAGPIESRPEAGRETETSQPIAIGDSARQALTPIYNAYFDAQMALANDDLSTARSAFARLAEDAESVPMQLFEGEAHDLWMKRSRQLAENARNGSTAGGFDQARASFREVSAAVIDLHAAFGHSGDQDFFLTFCPMAFDNEGAFWLQREDIVWNSFYGEQMLRCGTIKDTLATAAASSHSPEAGSTADVDALTPVYDAYFTVQMTLAEDEFEGATDAFADLARAVREVDMTAFRGQARDTWMDLANRLRLAAEAGTAATTIEDARSEFRALSKAAIDLHETFGHAGEGRFYLTYCPMAFDNAGAYWLQTENIVWNSFYGAAMLRCGEIKDTLQPTGAN